MAVRPQRAAAWLLAATATATAQAAPPPACEELRAALDRAASPASSDSAALRADPLYPYVQAARLRHALAAVPDGARDATLEARIRGFLARPTDEPVTRELSREWLAFLGERQAWTEFQAAAPEAPPDLSLQCYALQARLEQRDLDGLREAALALWLRERDTPPACAALFRWLDTPERLSDAEIEMRALFAAQSRAPLPAARADLLPPRRALIDFWDRLMAQPERELRRLGAGETVVPGLRLDDEAGDAAVEAFTRVARRDSRQARALFKPLLDLKMFSEAQRHRLRMLHALGLAYDFDAEAVKVFRDVPEVALDVTAREWRVRAALLHNETRWALHWLEAMPEPQRQEPRWKYWRARLLERHRPEQARALYAEVAQEREYYAFLAAERLKQKPDLRPLALPEDAVLQEQLAAVPAMRRARRLFECALPDLAAAEYRHALRERPAEARAQAARLVAGWGWHTPALLQLAALQLWDDLWLRFPLPYDPEIEAAAKDTGLPADWLYAVLRTESLYDPRAVSRAGALGLLQLRLPTARQVAQRAGLPRPERDDLFLPAVNIALGARYLREMHDRFGGHWALTLAAYNAGPQRIPDWLPQVPVEADVWIENIPYNETRTYVQRGYSALVMVGWRRRGEPTPLLPLLSPLPALKAEGTRIP
jgi:soluble lytic murein transglycosylase